MPDKPSLSDKARWDQAMQGIIKGSLAGALAGEAEFAMMRLDSLSIDVTAQARFNEAGEVFADTDEPGKAPVRVSYSYRRLTDEEMGK